MKVEFKLDTGCPGIKKEEIVELPDGINRRQIENMYQGWVWGIIKGSWKVLK